MRLTKKSFSLSLRARRSNPRRDCFGIKPSQPSGLLRHFVPCLAGRQARNDTLLISQRHSFDDDDCYNLDTNDMRLYLKGGQSILEYVVLLSMIISSLLIMQVFVKRSYQGRIKQEAQEIGPQYSPKHTASLVVTDVRSRVRAYTGGITHDGKPVPDGMTVTYNDTTTDFDKREAVDAFATE